MYNMDTALLWNVWRVYKNSQQYMLLAPSSWQHASKQADQLQATEIGVQGFVSNKDSDEEGKGDPLEVLLYAVFVATSERASVAELAGILSVEVPKLQMAISIACRLGFGTRLPPPGQLIQYLPQTSALKYLALSLHTVCVQ